MIVSKRNGGQRFRAVFGYYGGRRNLSGHRGTDADEKGLGNVDLGRCHDVVMGDLIEVVADDLRGFIEEQEQIVKIRDVEEEQKVLTAFGFRGRCNCGPMQIKTERTTRSGLNY